MVWFSDETSESRLSPCLSIRCFPESWNWRFLSNHLVFESGCSNGSAKTISELHVQPFIAASNITETKCKVNVFIVLDQIFDGQENSVESISDNICTKHGSSSNWNWIGINASKTFLINRVLTDCWRNLFFSWVSGKMIL